MTRLSVQESIRFGWERFWLRPWFFVGAYLIILIFNSGSQYSPSDGKSDVSASLVLLLVLIMLGLALLRIIIQMGEKRLLLNAYENADNASIQNLWTPHPFWRFLGAQILYAIIVVFGIILLIVPGVIWSLKYMFAPYIVIDRGMKPMDALRESARITSGHKKELFVLSLALAGVNLLGFLCFFVGVLVSIPVSMLATVYAYRFLEHQANEVAPAATTA